MSDSKPKDFKEEPYLSVLSQIKTLNKAWKTRLMIQALDKLDIAKGISNHRVLNFNSKPVFTHQKVFAKQINATNYADDIWAVKPRKKPLIGRWSKKVQINGYRRGPSRGCLDWSSKNTIIVAVGNKLVSFENADFQNTSRAHILTSPGLIQQKIDCIKSNHIGNRIAIASAGYTLSCLDLVSEKMLWSCECACSIPCKIHCIEWDSTDDKIIIGCSEGKICVFYNVKRIACSRAREYVKAHSGAILNLAISPNNHFIVTTGSDRNVCITLFPEMIPYFEIGYHDPAESLAWHPWKNGILCIGGGFGDGSISLWNVPRQESLGYKRVDFVSHVKHMAWNKLSGELVVVWYYWKDNIRFITIPVLASWDRIVDAVSLDFVQPTENRIAHVVWNFDNTEIALQTSNHVYCWNFFGDNASLRNEKSNKKKLSAGQKSIFNLCCIR